MTTIARRRPLSEIVRDARPGSPVPLGATVTGEGVNFCVYARRASLVQLLLFDTPGSPAPTEVLPLVPGPRGGGYWRVFLPGLDHGQVYGYRVHGPRRASPGDHFDPEKVLIDPYARAIAGLELYSRPAAAADGDNVASALRSVVVDPSRYDWEGDQPLAPPSGREIIYEMHVGAFTRSPTSGVPEARRGTFAGVIDKIPYLLELGVTAVELLPIQYFDPQDAPTGRTNTWGYSPLAWFAPHGGYAAGTDPVAAVDEVRDLIKALHRAGLRVILDVVYNHTAEGGMDGPVLSWRGFANSEYYILDRDRTRPVDFTGCGNTFSANHPVAMRMILDSLVYWVRDMHADGFRFDLASCLTRDELGNAQVRPPLIRLLETEPALGGVTLIAEPWDAAGLYQVGNFPAERFCEWNAAFRDDVRRFVRGDESTIEPLMARIVGSPDLFDRTGRDEPARSINFVTCHDGFTLADVVAYNRKHNETNGEVNRDGNDNNLSWNSGLEGPTRAALVNELRRRQVRNFMSFLLLSHGTPMLLMGDEVLRTQRGNNNAWCQDNPVGWFDWDDLGRHGDMLRFVKGLVAFSQSLACLRSDRYWRATDHLAEGDISWHGVVVGKPDWTPASHSLAYTLEAPEGQERVHVIANAWWHPLTFALPALPAKLAWHRVIDTSQPSPLDLTAGPEAPRVGDDRVQASWHTVIVLQAR